MAEQIGGMISTGSLAGKRFGFLEVLSLECRNAAGRPIYKCRCDCGDIIERDGYKISNGTIRSCGKFACRSKSMPQKGMTKQKRKTYVTWYAICRSPANVCREWQNDYLAFLSDMGERLDGQYLKKIDENGLYKKDNCFWGP